MGTTVPKVCPHAAAASEAAKTVFHQIDFSITIHSKNIRFLSFSTQFQAFGAAGPALTFNRRKFVPGGGNRTGRGAPGSSSLTPPAGCAPPPYYSALFLRRRTISPRNRTASTAQTMRIIELSIIAFSFPAKMTPLHALHHGEQFPYDFHDNRPHRDHEQRRQNTEKDGED